MKLQPNDRFSISKEVLSQELNGETVLLDLQGESYFGLNEVGTRIWQLIQSEQTVEGMKNGSTGISIAELEQNSNRWLKPTK